MKKPTSWLRLAHQRRRVALNRKFRYLMDRNRRESWRVVGAIIGHYDLSRHIRKMLLSNSPDAPDAPFEFFFKFLYWRSFTVRPCSTSPMRLLVASPGLLSNTTECICGLGEKTGIHVITAVLTLNIASHIFVLQFEDVNFNHFKFSTISIINATAGCRGSCRNE